MQLFAINFLYNDIGLELICGSGGVEDSPDRQLLKKCAKTIRYNVLYGEPEKKEKEYRKKLIKKYGKIAKTKYKYFTLHHFLYNIIMIVLYIHCIYVFRSIDFYILAVLFTLSGITWPNF